MSALLVYALPGGREHACARESTGSEKRAFQCALISEWVS